MSFFCWIWLASFHDTSIIIQNFLKLNPVKIFGDNLFCDLFICFHWILVFDLEPIQRWVDCFKFVHYLEIFFTFLLILLTLNTEICFALPESTSVAVQSISRPDLNILYKVLPLQIRIRNIDTYFPKFVKFWKTSLYENKYKN